VSAPADVALVRALAKFHVAGLEQEYTHAFSREAKAEMEHRFCYAIDQAIQTEREGIEGEIPDEWR
jgi:hypothetical protein